MPSLTGLTRRFQEKHGLQGENIRADQHLQDIQDKRMQQITLMEFQLSVQQVNPEKVLGFLGRGEVRGWHLKTLDGDPAVFVNVPLGHRQVLLGKTPLHQIFRVLSEFRDFTWADQAAHNQKTLPSERPILVYGDAVGHRPLRLFHRFY